MKRILAFAFLLSVTIGLVTGCSKSEPAPGGETAPTTNAPAAK
jgi:hypothetical protein